MRFLTIENNVDRAMEDFVPAVCPSSAYLEMKCPRQLQRHFIFPPGGRHVSANRY
jgi:hypothetical protein